MIALSYVLYMLLKITEFCSLGHCRTWIWLFRKLKTGDFSIDMLEFILIGGAIFIHENGIHLRKKPHANQLKFGGFEFSALMDGNREGYGCPVVVLCGCYRVFVSLTGRLQCTPWNSHVHPVIAT